MIIDELGRSASNNEGFGLSWAILEHIVNEIECLCLFSTHFHELTAIEKDLKNLKNYHLSTLAEGDKLTMQYKVKEGVIETSYGIHVAEMLKFPQEIVSEAKQVAS